MKRCNACDEEFQDRFSFCPTDGISLHIVPVVHSAPAEFQLTLVSDEALARRLANQLSFVIDQGRQAWPSFKNDPLAFSVKRIVAAMTLLKQARARPDMLLGATTALLVLVAIALSVLVLERHAPKLRDADLLEIVDALDGPGLLLGPAQCREQQAGEDGNDGNDDQQFDKSKSRSVTRIGTSLNSGYLPPLLGGDYAIKHSIKFSFLKRALRQLTAL